MRICVRAARDRRTFGPWWVWWAWLEPAKATRDANGNMIPSLDSISVGSNYGSWQEALRAGELARRTADIRFTSDAHGVITTVMRKGRR